MKAAVIAAIVAAIMAAGAADATISPVPHTTGTVLLCVNRTQAGGDGSVTQPTSQNGVATCPNNLQPIPFVVQN